MNEVLAAVVGAVITALLGLAAYLYRNRITYSLVTIQNDFSIIDGVILDSGSAAQKTLNAERLTLTNRGIRTLKSVVLHLERTPILVLKKISETNTISPSTVRLISDGSILSIEIPVFPAKEEIIVEFFTVAWPNSQHRELRATGGEYKIVTDRNYTVVRNGWGALYNLILAGAVLYLIFSSKK